MDMFSLYIVHISKHLNKKIHLIQVKLIIFLLLIIDILVKVCTCDLFDMGSPPLFEDSLYQKSSHFEDFWGLKQTRLIKMLSGARNNPIFICCPDNIIFDDFWGKKSSL